MSETENEEITSFEDLKIDPDILRGIFAYGFENPSPIQKKGLSLF